MHRYGRSALEYSVV
uniref:Uncharacterized protein n=1 Tax=Anopheles quadriannulatus TaxID=34691 RepID=A0A182XRF8_ANOQN